MKLRLERILVEHFLRAGFYESALQLSKSSGREILLASFSVFFRAFISFLIQRSYRMNPLQFLVKDVKR